MRLNNEFTNLYGKIEELSKREQHHIVDESKFKTLKNDILNILKNLFGEESREYGVVRLTNSPTVVFKVMNHIANRTETQPNINIAVNM